MNFWLFYVSLNLGYSPGGGLSVGISAGVGIQGVFSAGVSINYNYKSDSWSFTGNVGAAGFYAYAGYNTKGGWIAGAGFNAMGLMAWASPVSVSTDLFGYGVDYSQNGGWSANWMGMKINKNGATFDPSIGMSLTAKWGKESYNDEYQEGDGDKSKSQKFVFSNDYELIKYIKSQIDLRTFNIDEISAYRENFDYYDENSFTFHWRDKEGYLHQTARGVDTKLNGITFVEYSGFKCTNSIYLSRNTDVIAFIKTINHELTHAYINSHGFRSKMDEKSFKNFTESSAYMAGQGYIPQKYNQSIFPIVVPPHLLYVPTW